MRELQPGVWHWEARHPEWTEEEPWRPEVSSYAIDDGGEAFAGRRPNDLLLWFESRRALISGDTLADFGGGIQIHDEWLWGVTREEVVDALRPLLALPVELVLPAHGAPTDRAALERALS